MLEMSRKDRRTNLEKEIDRILVQMNELRDVDDTLNYDTVKDQSGTYRYYLDERYIQLVQQLERLYKMRDVEKKNEMNPNTILTVGGSFASILGILIFERTDILRTKALQFVLRGRV